MMKLSLSDILQDASARSQCSLIESKAEKEMYKVPWLSVKKHGLPQNDSASCVKVRKQHLVKTETSVYAVTAHFGFKGHDWWITPTGQLLTPDFGHIVTHWAPLPPAPDEACQPIPAPTGGTGSSSYVAIPENR